MADGSDPGAPAFERRAGAVANGAALAGILVLAGFAGAFAVLDARALWAPMLVDLACAAALGAVFRLNRAGRRTAAGVVANLFVALPFFLGAFLFFGPGVGYESLLILCVILPPLTFPTTRSWLPIGFVLLDLAFFLTALLAPARFDRSGALPAEVLAAQAVVLPFLAVAGIALVVAHYRASLSEGERALVRRTERLEAALAEVRRLAETDALTGLRNRRVAEEALRTEMARSERYRVPFSVVMVDVDHFKSINDTLGHEQGDRVLRRVAELLRGMVRETDVVARWGGEEFLVLLPHTDVEGGATIAEKLRRSMHDAFREERTVTASFGVAQWRLGETAAQLVARADEAMYGAKAAGRDRIAADLAAEGRVRAVSGIAWRWEWDSGDERLDRQHRHMLGLANDIVAYGLLEADRPRALELMDELVEETARHFAFEEDVLRAVGFEGLAAHQGRHASLAAQAAELRDGVRSGARRPIAAFVFVLDEVVAGHLMHDDAQYFEAVRAARAREAVGSGAASRMDSPEVVPTA